MQDLFNNILNKTITGTGDSDQHLMTLFSLVLQTKAQEVLELGVREGVTTEALLLGTHLNRGILMSVDLMPTSWKCPQEYKDNWHFVQQDAIKYLEEAVKANLHYDLIFVDDWHSYSHVKKELELIKHLTDEKSLIVLHDLMAFTYPQYHLPLNSPPDTEWGEGGPTRAVFELDKNMWEYVTIPVNNGLTILRQIK